MITLDAVESFFPERSVTVEERAAQLGLTPAQTHMFRRIQGLDRMHYDPDLTLYDVVLPAARKVLAQTDASSVRYVIYAHAVHGANSAAADTAQELKRQLGLEHATAFALTQQNCAIPLSAVDVAGTLLRADGNPGARALVVTGEKLPLKMAKTINTVMLADGAASCLVSWNGPGTVVRSFATRTRGEYYNGLRGTPEQFRAAAEMRPVVLREVMMEAVARAGCTLDEVGVIIPPNQGFAFWSGSLDAEELFGKCFFENNGRYSHCLAADLFINYVTLRDQQRLEPGRPAMFIATGLGWTFSAMVIVPSTSTGAC